MAIFRLLRLVLRAMTSVLAGTVLYLVVEWVFSRGGGAVKTIYFWISPATWVGWLFLAACIALAHYLIQLWRGRSRR